MSFRFKQASCVAIGTFNIYVLRPNLLVDLGIVSSDTAAVKLETNLTQPGFRFSSQQLRATWTVRPDKVIVETTDPEKDCGSDLAVVLEALRWTPITALGSNFEFVSKTAPGRLAPFPKSEIDAAVLQSECVIVQSTIHVGIRESDQILNFQLSSDFSEFELACNVHREVQKGNSQPASNADSQNFARQFNSDRTKIEVIASRLFSIAITHDNVSTDTTALNVQERDSA